MPSSSWPKGAGQDLLAASGEERDASGNVKLKDIGLFLRERIEAHFKAEKVPVVMRYFDPSYLDPQQPGQRRGLDPVRPLCAPRGACRHGRQDRPGDRLPPRPVHPCADRAAGRRRKRLDLDGELWRAVLSSTGQPVTWV